MPYTILHLSDLHRALDDPIGNDELLSTLAADRDRFGRENPAISEPDAIVVSGDLVQGAALGLPNYGDVLESQYRVAAEFLARLAEELLSGDRARLIVVPGNHDIDWNTAFAAMDPIDPVDLPRNFSPALCGPTAHWRWRWDGLQAYRISDRGLYEQRLARFDAALDSLYSTAADIAHSEHFRIHSLLDGRVAVVAFNSCIGNDCFARHGAIHEEAIAQAHMALRSSGHELRIAVWHHSIEGDPHATDYMAVSTVHRLIGRGFRVGFHGHQHRAAAALRYIHLPDEERMAVVSAGSLCAGPRELPAGVNRQYNVVELADDLRSARVHVREMAIATNFAPARRNEFGGKSYVDLEWRLPRVAANAAAERERQLILAAEAALAAGDNQQGLSILEALSPPLQPYARQLLLETLRDLRRWKEIVNRFSDPITIDELVAVTRALAEVTDLQDAEQFLANHAKRLDLPEPIERDVRAALSARGKTT